MHTFRKRSGIYIPIEFCNKSFYVNAKELLVRRMQHYQDSAYTLYKFYLESDKGLLLPRFFPISDYVPCQIDDISCDGEDIDITHTVKPRNELQKKAIEHMLSNDSGIMQLQPGTGKTVISICVIAERKKKTLILVHRFSLVDQWKEEFHKFTNMTDNDIAKLSSSTFEEDLKKPIIIATDQTFISLLKRNRSEFLKALGKANIGILLADEVHTTVGAPTFSECSIHVPAKVIFGLSATPYRYDGNSDVIEMHLGSIYVDEDVGGTMTPRVTVLLLNYGIMKKSARYVNWGGKFQRSRYLNLMKNTPVFLTTVKALLTKFNDREVILVAERIKLLEQLYDWCKCDSKSKFIQNAGNDQLAYQMVFATSMKIRDGVNIPQKDCLIMTSPVSNIAQMIGRVIRSSDGKKQPIVIDMVDVGCWDICRSLRKRLDFYQMKKWGVQFINIRPDGKKELMNEKKAVDLIKTLWDNDNRSF